MACIRGSSDRTSFGKVSYVSVGQVWLELEGRPTLTDRQNLPFIYTDVLKQKVPIAQRLLVTA